eukprot:2277058-Rhodomonas_salina.2
MAAPLRAAPLQYHHQKGRRYVQDRARFRAPVMRQRSRRSTSAVAWEQERNPRAKPWQST